jgi:hypothetical protein
MPSYLVESYLSASSDALEDARSRARRAAEADPGVRYVRTTFVPGDETIFHVFEAPSAEALERASILAGLAVGSIAEAIDDPSETR